MSIFPATHLRKQKHFRATIFGQTDFRGLQSTTSFEFDEVIKPGVFGELRPIADIDRSSAMLRSQPGLPIFAATAKSDVRRTHGLRHEADIPI